MIKTNKLYNEDCRETMARMPENFIDLIVTSPPYDNLRTYNNNIDISWKNDIWKAIIKDIYRIMKNGGVVVWIVDDGTINGNKTGTSFKQALFAKKIGFNLYDTMIYCKNNISFPNKKRYSNAFEYMFIFSKSTPKTINILSDRKNKSVGQKIGYKHRSKTGELVNKSFLSDTSNCNGVIGEFGNRFNVWHYNVGWQHSYNEKYISKHPAVFPEKLAEDHIISWSNPGDLIYDPFSGSGTTAKMAIKLGRNYIASEISSEYCSIAHRRINDMKNYLF